MSEQTQGVLREKFIQQVKEAQENAWPPHQLNHLLQHSETLIIAPGDTILPQHIRLLKEVKFIRKAHLMLSEMDWLDWHSKHKLAQLQQCVEDAYTYSPQDKSLEEITRQINFKTGNRKEMKASDLKIYNQRRQEIIYLIVAILFAMVMATFLLRLLLPWNALIQEGQTCDRMMFKDGTSKLLCYLSRKPGKVCVAECAASNQKTGEFSCSIKSCLEARTDVCDPLLALS